MVDPGFWRDRSVLVTGHTGFKGSWLAQWLDLMGARVSGLSLPGPHWAAVPALVPPSPALRDLRADIRDLAATLAGVQEARPEVVLHLAAQALVRPSYADPLGAYAANVMGTAHVLEAVRRTPGVRAVLVVTSDKCYANREWVWPYREDDPLGGHDPYSSSKACAELAAAAWRDSFFPPGRHAEHGVAVATARAGNVVGGGDWGGDRLVPDLVRAALAGQVTPIRSPGAVRPWQHVLDPLAGYLQLAERLVQDGPAAARAWNFGPLDTGARTVGWIADRFCSLWGEGAAWSADPGEHPHEAHFLKLDSSRARWDLGWSPRLDVGQALEWSVDWYRACCAAPDSAGPMTREQIGRYMETPAA